MLAQEQFNEHRSRAYSDNLESQYIVGCYYLENKDNYEAKKWLEKATNKGHKPAGYKFAKLLIVDLERISSSECIKAADLFFKVAEDIIDAREYLRAGSKFYGIIEGIVNNTSRPYGYCSSSDKGQLAHILAKIHQSTLFQSQDDTKVLHYYQKATEFGCVEAANEYADLFYYGRLVKQDHNKAYELFKHICQQNLTNHYSYCRLAYMLEHGEGVIKNIDEAINYYERAAKLGNIFANVALGRIYYGKYCQTTPDEWRRADYKRTALHYLEQVDTDKTSQNYMGLIYYTEKNYQQAAQWFERAAKQGLLVAQYNLGTAYEKLNRYNEAIAWYEKSAGAGYDSSQYKVGCCYEKGELGVKQDKLEAFQWFIAAVSSGNQDAKALLADNNKPFYHYKRWYDATNKNITRVKQFLELENCLGYEFDDPNNLLTALNRRQHPLRKEAEFQRYECLGDAILKAVVINYLVKNADDALTTGNFNIISQRMIANNTVLPKVATQLNLQNFLELDVTEKNVKVTEKMLADACESVIGAIVRDSAINQAEAVVVKLWTPYLQEAMKQVDGKQEILEVKPIEESKLTLLKNNNNAKIVSNKSTVENAVTKQSQLSPRTQRLFSCITSKDVKEKTLKNAMKESPDINRQNIGKKGDTPLMTLIRREKLRTTHEIPRIKLLLEYGALWTAPNKLGKTAEQLLQEKHPEINKQQFQK
ncbi:MAG: hypothetical protein Tsb005_17690 [Gammaproteobacteria bacterium]